MSVLFASDNSPVSRYVNTGQNRGQNSPMSRDISPPSRTYSGEDNPRMSSNIQNRIRERLNELGLTEEQASRKAGLDKTYLRKMFERPDQSPRGQTLGKLAQALEAEVSWLLSDGDSPTEFSSSENPPRTRQVDDIKSANVNPPDRQSMVTNIPVMGTAAGSMAGAFQLEQGPVDWVRRPPALLGARDIYAIYIEGQSMEPEHRPGDLRFVHPHKPAKVGDTVIVQISMTDHDGIQSMIGHLTKRTATTLYLGKLNPVNTVEIPIGNVKAVHKVLTMNELFGV